MDQLVEPVGSFGGYQKINLVIVGCVTMISAMYYNMIIINYIEPSITCHVRKNLANNFSTMMDSTDENYTTCDMWNSFSEHEAHNTKSPFVCTG